MSPGDDTVFDPMVAVIKFASERFADRWRRQQDTRVKDFLEEVPLLLTQMGVSDTDDQHMRWLIAELIRVEVACRLSRDEAVQREEFLDRFPEFNHEIDSAFRSCEVSMAEPEASFKAFSADAPLLRTAVGNSGTRPQDHQLDERGNEVIPPSIGPYRRIKFLAKGSFGIVCSAFDSERLSDVALKFPRQRTISSPENYQLFLEEGQRTQALIHPRIARTFAIETINGYVFMVQQLFSGGTLKEVLANERSFKQTANLIAMIADGLAFANLQGLVHRDLKPANILLDTEGLPYIADFGLALDENQQLGAPKSQCGTVSYMSPQMADGLTRNLDGRADIWSLGVILYEMLAGRKPFRGKEAEEVLEQIRGRDPKPLRQIRPEIPRELERICLKCLAKPARERYLTASDLAEDLRHWIANPTDRPTTANDSSFNPKGLSSYGPEDASFFLQLLPGPKDRYGLPASLQFWRQRILEPVSPTATTPVGVLYGPSGSGKSSFVKAGLLPQLGPDVDCLYVECRQDQTESQLKAALVDRFPAHSESDSLPQIMASIANGPGETGRKILLVLDQFEQRLASKDPYAGSELAHALKFCDGHRIQALLLVRDDYWRSLTRFMDALELDLREGQNTQSIDLFDNKHAESVLLRLGMAYGKIASPPGTPSEESLKFVEEVVRQISDNDLVVCIRLTLFAEWFKNRPWTLEQLEQVGGATGSATKYLESAFDHSHSPGKWKHYRPQAQAVLQALLPESKNDLKNTTRHGRDLMVAAGIQQVTDFQSVIKILQEDLRLITRTDDHSLQQDDQQTGIENDRFQLMHDFLVPPLRQWLRQDLALTPGGRSRLRLADLAHSTSEDQLDRIKVSHWEWLNWKWHLRAATLSGPEQKIMASGRRRFIRNVGTAAAAAGFIGLPALWITDRQWKQKEADYLLGNLLSSKWDTVPKVVAQLSGYRSWIEQPLKELSASGEPEQQFRAQLGLLSLGMSDRNAIRDYILASDSRPEIVQVAATLLDTYRADDSQLFQEWEAIQEVEDFGSAPNSLDLNGARILRWMAFDSQYHGQKTRAAMSQQLAARLGTGLEGEPTSDHPAWLALLKPLADQAPELGLHFLQRFNASPPPQHTALYAQACFELLPAAKRATMLLEHIQDWNDLQFDSVFRLFEYSNRTRELEDALSELPTAPRMRGVVAVAKLRLGDAGPYRELMRSFDNLFSRSVAILHSVASRLPFTHLKELFSPWKELESAEDALQRHGILLAMSRQLPDMLPEERNWLQQKVAHTYQTDHHAGCFSAAEWFARQMNMDLQEARTNRLAISDLDGRLGNIVMGPMDMVFAVIQVSDENETYELAISTKALTNEQAMTLAQELDKNRKVVSVGNQKPFTPRNFGFVYQLCNQLSKAAKTGNFYQITEGDNSSLHPKFDIESNGFRLMGEHEVVDLRKSIWQYVDPVSQDLANLYAWHYRNAGYFSESNDGPDVGQLLPHHSGIFDWIGELVEVTVDYKKKNLPILINDGFHRQDWEAICSSQPEEIGSPFDIINDFTCIRVARRLEPTTEK